MGKTDRMPTVLQCLPRTAQLLPSGEAGAAVAEDATAFVDLLAAVHHAAATQSTIFGIDQVCEAAMSDLGDLVGGGALWPGTIDATCVGVSTLPALAACLRGDLDAARAWLIRGLGGGETADTSFSLAGVTFLRVAAAGRNETALDIVADFAHALFYLVRSAGYLLEASEAVGAELATELARFPVRMSTLDAVPHALAWARSVDRDDLLGPLRDWCCRSADVFDVHRPPFRPTAAVELRFAVAVSLELGQERVEALRHCVDLLDVDCPPELAVQVLAAACEDDADMSRQLMPKLLDGIAAIMNTWSEQFGVENLGAFRERRLNILGAPLTALARDGDVANAVALLRAWAGVDDGPLSSECAGRVQLCIHGIEHTYAWAGGSCTAPVTVTSQKVAAVTNHALGSALVATGPGAQRLHLPASSKVDRAWGMGFGDTSRELLALDQCPGFTQSLSSSGLFIPIPGYRVPYQGLLAEHGSVPAMWISLREPAPDKWVDRVLIASGDTALSGVEAALVAAAFNFVGIDVDHVGVTEGRAVADRVNEALRSDEYAIIWIAAHGRQPDYEPLAAAISLPAEQVLTERELRIVPAEVNQRRLLVLSSCDGAATMQATGLRARGLAAAAAGPHQAVVGHQWVVSERLAAAFGVLFGAALAETRDFNDAFSIALGRLRRPWPENAELLAGFHLDAELIAKLGDGADFSANVLDYAAPAFYC